MGAIIIASLPIFLVNLLHLYFMCQLLPNRLNRYTLPCAAAVIAVVNAPRFALGIFTVYSQVLQIILAVLGILVLPLVCFRGKVWKRLLLNVYFWGVQMLCDALAYYACPGLDVASYLTWDPIWYLIYMAIGLSCFTLTGMLSVFIGRRLSLDWFRPFYLLFAVFPVSLWLLVYSYVFQVGNPAWLLGVALSSLAQIALLWVVVSLERKSALEQELKEIRHTMEMEQAYYRAVEERREELARIRHDFNNHLAVISQLMGAGAEQDAQQMLHHLAEDIGQTKENPYCAIPVVNAILHEKAMACAQKAIKLEVELDLPEGLRVEPLHLCSIFSNLLDNAIRGVEESQESAPRIRLSSMADGDYLFIKTVNTARPPEEAPPGRGLGLRILDSLAQQYGGTRQARYQDGIYTSVVSLLASPEPLE